MRSAALVTAVLAALAAAPARAQPAVAFPHGPGAQACTLGASIAAEARAMRAPAVRPGGLRKQRWWVERRLGPWMLRRGGRVRAVSWVLFHVYRRRDLRGALAQALVATSAAEYAEALRGLRARAPTARARALFAGTIDRALVEVSRTALLAYARCEAVADGLNAAIGVYCRDGAARLVEGTTHALGSDDWRPDTGPDGHVERWRGAP